MFNISYNDNDIEILKNKYNQLYLEDLAAELALKNIQKQEENIRKFLTNNNISFKNDSIIETMILTLSRSTNDNLALFERYLSIIYDKLCLKHSKEYATKIIKDIRYCLNTSSIVQLDDLILIDNDHDLISIFNNIKDCINIINANSSTLDELKKIVNERNILINANNARNKAMNKLLNKINKYNNSDGMKR